ncbi:MAG: polysaccharide biosynthesis tyrosine autokinase [Solirubrobacteraceae bacterium]
MSTGSSDLRTYLKALWRWKPIFLAFVVLAPVIAYVVASREPYVYQSSVLLQEDALPVSGALFSSEGAAAPSAAPEAESLTGEARVIETPAVARLAASHLHPAPGQPSALLAEIKATAETETGFITVTARAPAAARAAEVANAFGKAVVHLRTQQAIGLITHAIDQVEAQIGQLRASDHLGRKQLSGQLQRLRALRAAQGANAQILQAATPVATPVSPHIGSAVALGLVAGLLLGFGAVFAAESADRRMRHPEDLEELTGLPLLAVIPRGAFSEKPRGSRHDEAFHMLRSALTFFNVDRPLASILVSSPLKGDGKTTVATHLARAAAQSGREVILIDADLRRPQAASRLGVSGETTLPGHGLAAVLSSQISLQDGLVDVTLSEHESDGSGSPPPVQGRLRLLPAGGTPPNPSQLLSSERMREVIRQAEQAADLVILDTNPVLSVSDSLPLFDAVSGIVLVARLNGTSRDAVRRLLKTIANTGGNLLGVVATGASGGGMYGYYGYGYGYGYAADQSNGNGNGAGPIRRLRHAARSRQRA